MTCVLPCVLPFVRVGRRSYHTACFVCSNPSCRVPLTAAYSSGDSDVLLCEACYLDAHTPRCSVCQQKMVRTASVDVTLLMPSCVRTLTRRQPNLLRGTCKFQGGYILTDGMRALLPLQSPECPLYRKDDVNYCANHYGQLFAAKCGSCGLPVLTDGVKMGSGVVFHNACFTCGRCGDVLPSSYNVDKAGTPICRLCYTEHVLPRCAVCHTPQVCGVEGNSAVAALKGVAAIAFSVWMGSWGHQ